MTAATMGSATPGRGDIAFGALDLEDIARAADADCIGALACGPASFSYHRLPEPRLRLTIRKLDDSYFDVQIARSAAVWELKAAIEAVFIALFYDMDNAITWQHVWSHFCLCFKDEKLTDDRATLRAFGIKDGDELHFSQHLSVDYSPCKRSKSQRSASHRRSRTSVDDFGVRSRTLLDDLIEEDEAEKLTTTRHSTSALEEGFGVYQQYEYMEEGGKKGSFFSNWFSYSRLRGNRRTHSEDAAQSSCEKKANRPKLGKWLSSKKSKAQRK
ncbi:uncharacterized protein LOC100841643 [Brachypodium distachyon]|uniref:SNRNP25 ubiquitin-like domain-containing protein n=1 Tax=Brachypodium distachyon TaxID=15368 RepID=I1HY50_BRADI|nr:uncharacterized protein LOC100841643 [Brachypodium distachyon]PNT66061.1 hypothetical protein BRADI_3g06500v3 [Brachypodium distachyon]|eukprot:XP_010233944.1 uncharacterized protein LOC100841643 [Brachypodium distachyon]